MTRDDLEAANWTALARYGKALSQPDAQMGRIQSRFIDDLTVNAQSYASAQVHAALHPVWQDPEKLVGKAIDLLAEGLGVKHLRAKRPELTEGNRSA